MNSSFDVIFQALWFRIARTGLLFCAITAHCLDIASAVDASATSVSPASLAVSATDAPPRLWKAVSGNATLYLLGATHYGLPSEYGRYFEQVVLPAFDTADRFLFEGAGGREPEPRMTCDPSVLNADGKRVLAEARKKVADTAVKAREVMHRQMKENGVPDLMTEKQRNVLPRAYIDSLDEFSLIQQYNIDSLVLAYDAPAQVPSEPQTTQGTDNHFGPSVVETLRRLRPELPIVDVDTRFGVRRAYCSAGPERIHYLESELHSERGDSVAAMTRVPALESEFSTLLTKGKAPPGGIGGLPELDQTFICQRNSEWLRAMANVKDGKTYFYVVGARHLFDVDHDAIHCKGLLTGLAERGLQVQLLK